MNAINMIARTAAALALALAFAIIPPAQAGTAAPSRHVSYADLDMDTEDGAQILYNRINKAARKVCHSISPPYHVQDGIRYNKCVSALINSAVTDVGKPILTAMHQRLNQEKATLKGIAER